MEYMLIQFARLTCPIAGEEQYLPLMQILFDGMKAVRKGAVYPNFKWPVSLTFCLSV